MLQNRLENKPSWKTIKVIEAQPVGIHIERSLEGRNDFSMLHQDTWENEGL